MVHDLVLKNRSYRGFDESYSFTRDQLLKYVDCARLCASSVNKQPLKYRLVFEREEAARLFRLTKWARALPQLTLPHPGMAPTAFIVICQDFEISDADTAFFKDIGISAQTILLAAVEEGLGGCMIGNFKPQEVSDELGLSANLAPRLVIALGKPAEKIVITEVGENGSTDYYRDESDVHYVPKRSLNNIII